MADPKLFERRPFQGEAPCLLFLGAHALRSLPSEAPELGVGAEFFHFLVCCSVKQEKETCGSHVIIRLRTQGGTRRVNILTCH